MKSFKNFIDEGKKCPDGEYYCHEDEKCKKIPRGYRVGYGGYLRSDRSNDDDNSKNGNGGSNGNGNGGHSNGSGSNGGGNGGGNGGSGGGE